MSLALAIGLALHLRVAYDEALESAETLVVAVVKAIAERVEGDMRTVEALLNETAASVQIGDDYAAELTQRLFLRMDQFPELHFIGRTAVDGRRIGPAWPEHGAPPIGERLFGDNPPLLTAGGSPSVIVLKPDKPREPNHRQMYVVRPLAFADGAAAAAVNPDAWARFLDSVLVDAQGGAAIIHESGIMVARAPEHAPKFAMDISNSDLFRIWLPYGPGGVIRLVAKSDNNDKIIAYRRLAGYPLVATCGVSISAALADWKRTATVEIFSALILLAAAYYWAARSDRTATALAVHGMDLENAVENRTRELAEARDAAAQTADRLRKVNRELQRMAMVAAHHLQEPLRPMVSYSQLLHQRLQGGDVETDDMLTFIRTAALRQKALLRDFQRYVAALTEEPQLHAVDVEKTAQAAAAAVARRYGKQLTTTCVDLPTINADASLIRDLFFELLTNAVLHGRSNGTATVRISAVRDGDDWVFRVADDGPGVPAGLRERVFQVFETISGRLPDATGLGLPLCRLIVESHGGDICIEPSPTGAVLRFRLPDRPVSYESFVI